MYMYTENKDKMTYGNEKQPLNLKCVNKSLGVSLFFLLLGSTVKALMMVVVRVNGMEKPFEKS